MGCGFDCAGFSTTRLGHLADHVAEVHSDWLGNVALHPCPDCEYSTPFSHRYCYNYYLCPVEYLQIFRGS